MNLELIPQHDGNSVWAGFFVFDLSENNALWWKLQGFFPLFADTCKENCVSRSTLLTFKLFITARNTPTRNGKIPLSSLWKNPTWMLNHVSVNENAVQLFSSCQELLLGSFLLRLGDGELSSLQHCKRNVTDSQHTENFFFSTSAKITLRREETLVLVWSWRVSLSYVLERNSTQRAPTQCRETCWTFKKCAWNRYLFSLRCTYLTRTKNSFSFPSNALALSPSKRRSSRFSLMQLDAHRIKSVRFSPLHRASSAKENDDFLVLFIHSHALGRVVYHHFFPNSFSFAFSLLLRSFSFFRLHNVAAPRSIEKNK